MKILYFSWLREKIGVPFEELEVQSENVHDLIKELIRTDQKYALAFEDIKSIRVAVDQKLIQNLNVSIKNVKEILETLGMDMTDDSLKGTPKRVAKAYVKELFGGLNPKNLPTSSTFENKYQYGEMLVEKNITVFSTCEHHLLPIYGKAHVAYIPNERVVGLSKLARVVEVFSKRLQTQERLTMQIANTLMQSLDAKGVAVLSLIHI